MTYVLDPQARVLLDKAEASGRPEIHTLDVAPARALFGELAAAVAVEPPAVGDVTNRAIPGPAGDIAARVYRPVGGGNRLPILVYYHGGGWVVGNLESHDSVCRWLCARAGAVVVSVDYRLAPEHKFPAAVDDAYGAACWVSENADALGGDASRLAVGGDSAGATLATVVARLAHDAGPAIAYQMLIYPATDLTMASKSHAELAEGYRLTRTMMHWFLDKYVPEGTDRTDPRASPAFTEDLSGLPPALVITAGFDPLRDEGQAYVEKMRAAGVAVEHRCYEGMIHGFFHMGGWLDASRDAMDFAADAMAGALAPVD